MVRPEVRKDLKRSRQRKCAATIASRLPTKTKRGRNKADAAYRNRVGWKAQVLRKVSHISRFLCFINEIVCLTKPMTF